MTPEQAVAKWREFAATTRLNYRGTDRTWQEQIRGGGYPDEEQVIQPRVFPLFVQRFLGFEVGVNLAAEALGTSGKPDFTPADAVTHPFVFETKSTNLGVALAGQDAQVERYLRESRERIKRVVLTNLVGLRVFALDPATDQPVEEFAVNLKGLLELEPSLAAKTEVARALVRFIAEFSRQQLTRQQKLSRARQAPPWVPALEVTNAVWLSERLDRVVATLTGEVDARFCGGELDRIIVADTDRTAIEHELRELELRIEEDLPSDSRSLSFYASAAESSAAGKARRQYCAHVAYFCATRLLLVRLFEDLDLLEPILYDGGLDQWLDRLQGAVADVVAQSYIKAQRRYPSLFDASNAYTWYRPSGGVLTDVIYELSSTYLGGIESDVLGVVYERLLTRVDRKLLGQYYTPRDVIALIWDILGMDQLAQEAEVSHDILRVLDIATGSGGFLVSGARQLRDRTQSLIKRGARLQLSTWVRDIAEGFVGIEIQRFPAYLAELNVLIQLAIVASEAEWQPPIPPVGVLCCDTLATHNATTNDHSQEEAEEFRDPFRQRMFEDVRDPGRADNFFDFAVGNPPYVGEKLAASTIRWTRDRHPYWNRYYAQHLDYLYWFLILGISKLRRGGRFGFITTEYWLRATGAAPLRRFLAQHCEVDRLILFRNLRLFPDAPGQHSMIVAGSRIVEVGDRSVDADPAQTSTRPTVSIYEGPNVRERRLILEAMHDGRSASRVRSFQSTVVPNRLSGDSWAEVILSRTQVNRRLRLRDAGPPALDAIEEGVITGANRMRPADRERLSQTSLREIDQAGVRGIFVLSSTELGGLGQLRSSEQAVVREVINTKHVFPYAAVLPPDHDSYLYLARPERGNVDMSNARTLPFPDGMPNLERHLSRFRPILERKVAGYNERRPWWSLHRPRPGIESHQGTRPTWANYAVTARWGLGGRLVVGLAPRKAAPADGLHALLPSEAAPAEYLVALLNSTPVQEIADTVPPGQLRKNDLIQLGIPRLDTATVKQISAKSIELAGLVVQLVTRHGLLFPDLAETLRGDLRLASCPDDVWNPPADLPSASGRLQDVPWVRDIGGSRGREITRSAHLEQTLFGGHIRVEGRHGQVAFVDLSDPTPEVLEALRARLRGLVAVRGRLVDIAEVVVPIDPAHFIATYADHRQQLAEAVSSYRLKREEIDALITAPV